MQTIPEKFIRSRQNQSGAILITALIMLVMLTLLGLSSMSTTTMEERMAANSQESNRAFQAASVGLARVIRDANAITTANTLDNDGTVDDSYTPAAASVGATGSYSYTASTSFNAVYLEAKDPRREEDKANSVLAFDLYYFDLSATGTTDTGATSTLRAGVYQKGPNEEASGGDIEEVDSNLLS